MYRLTVIVVALLVIVALAAAPTSAPAAGGPPMPTLPATQPPKRTPGAVTPTAGVEQATLSAAWAGHDLVVTWGGDGTSLVLLQSDGSTLPLAYTAGTYTVKGRGVDRNAGPQPGDGLIIYGRDGQRLAYLLIPPYPITPRAILPVIVR